MKDSTRQKIEKTIRENNGILKEYIKKSVGWDVVAICSNGSVFKKEYRKIHSQWCPYLCCNRGKNGKIDDDYGFEIYRQIIKKESLGKIICKEKSHYKKWGTNESWATFECLQCNYIWNSKCTTQLAPISSTKRIKGCANCAGQVDLHKKRINILKKANLRLITPDNISLIRNNHQLLDLLCELECKEIIHKSINKIDTYLKNDLGWCTCTRKRTKWTIEKVTKKGLQHGYKLIFDSNELNHIKYNTNFTWECSKGHQTIFSIASLKNGCNKCYYEKRISNIEKVKNFIHENALPIQLLPNQIWTNSLTKLKFRCNNCDADFDKLPTSIIYADQGCPKCSKIGRSNSEIYVHHFIEDFLNIRMKPNLKPFKWLTYNGNKLELDGFCEEHNIAFEHHGIQHYEYNEFFHDGDVQNFELQKLRDETKSRLCSENNIKLIIIPALNKITPKEMLASVLEDEIERLNIAINQ
jgi:hypothetical protein